MQLAFPDDEAVQPHLKLLALAKRWKKGQDDVPTTTAPPSNPTTEANANSTTPADDNTPLPAAHIDDEEMNDES